MILLILIKKIKNAFNQLKLTITITGILSG